MDFEPHMFYGLRALHFLLHWVSGRAFFVTLAFEPLLFIYIQPLVANGWRDIHYVIIK